MRHNLLVANGFQHVLHSLRQLVKRHHVFVISHVQIKSNALSDVIGQPPTGITSFVSGPCDRRVKPIAIEFEKLSGVRAEVRKFLFKSDHGACSSKFCAVRAWNLAGPHGETTPAGAHWVLRDVPTYEWRLQIH